MVVLIKNAYIITQNEKREQIPEGFIVIMNDRFEKIVEGQPGRDDLMRADKIIDASGMAVLPGFINAHVHLGESIFEDFFTGEYSLEHYLLITDELVRKTDLIECERDAIADYSLLNLIKSGTTTICGGRTTDSSERWGMRNVSGYMLMNSYKLKNLSTDVEKKFKDEYLKIKKTSLSYPALFIHSLNAFDHALIKNVKNILADYPDVRLILHIAETEKQEQEIRNKIGVSSVEFLCKNGLLDKRTVLIHGNYINEDDKQLIKKHNASIAHCLSSNLKIAGKTLELKGVLAEGIRTCIATDGSVTSGTFSVLQEAAKCFSHHNVGHRDNLITMQKILDLITIDVARVLGLESDIGSIENGKKADVVFVKNGNCDASIIDGVIRNRQGVVGMILDGELKIWNNSILRMDEKEILERFRTLTNKIKEAVL